MANNQKNKDHRFAQGAWRIIKEYAGIYGILRGDELREVMCLPTDQLIGLCVTSTRSSKPMAGGGQQLHDLLLMQNTKKHHKWRAYRDPNLRSKFIDAYYTKFHPESIEKMKEVMAEIGKPVPTGHAPHTFMPGPKPTKKRKEIINSILFKANMRDSIELFHREEFERREKVCRLITKAPNREDIYRRLKKGVRTPMQYCPCGDLVNTQPSKLKSHLKTKRHLKGVMHDCNLKVIDEWHRTECSIVVMSDIWPRGAYPPGFAQVPGFSKGAPGSAARRWVDGGWEHIIPGTEEEYERQLAQGLTGADVNIAAQMVCSTMNGGCRRY